MLYLSDLLEGG